MQVYEICKMSASCTVEIREWGLDYHEELAVVSKASVFEQNLLGLVRSCLFELGYSEGVDMEIREQTLKQPATRSYRLVLIAKSLSKTRLREIKLKAKAIISSVSQGQSDWVDEKIDTVGLECSLPENQKKEIDALKQAFQKKYSKSKVPNTFVQFEGEEWDMCVSQIKPNPPVESVNEELHLKDVAINGVSRRAEKISIDSPDGKVIDLGFERDRMAEDFFESVLSNVFLNEVEIKRATNRENGKEEYSLQSAKITLPTGETLTLKP